MSKKQERISNLLVIMSNCLPRNGFRRKDNGISEMIFKNSGLADLTGRISNFLVDDLAEIFFTQFYDVN